jgi:hypothetical protein
VGDDRGDLAVTSHDPSALNTSTFDHVTVSSGPSQDIDIGDTGADIWGTQDAFNYFYEALSGDGQMQVRMTHLDNTDTFAKAGIMIRASTDPASAHVLLDVRPDGNLEFLQRASTGGETTFLGTAPVTFPVTLWLWRVGSSFNAAYAQDGICWTHLESTSGDLPVEASIGVALTSHQRGVLATATVTASAARPGRDGHGEPISRDH